ncbi:BgTH12-04929 [Blumeria graminis f. sp. triticale]|uniref:Bgt-353-2 n=3 Tax=Blumeria graminis TaxID=34373 RepID=A0A061HIL7_BLUGR|nr:hypothetical protein BGT96224_353B [Blumeria graminis f. sp. tritici 96224]CAD6502336.1 BgTH12-04929 [Blumeria graminis f. sp. triticale]VDB87590.1 Bgt-353-2 [Blumeria graminis f. sp. tritici]
MFFSQGSFAETGWEGCFSGGGRMQYIYPGPTTLFTFANGSSLILENTARILADFSDVANG